MSSVHIGGYTFARTRFGNNRRVLALSCIVTQAAKVFTVNTEHVLVADDQIRCCAVWSSVVLINSEPLLKTHAICKLAYILNHPIERKSQCKILSVVKRVTGEAISI